MNSLISEIKSLESDIIVRFESSGGYERELLYKLSHNRISFVLIKPTNIRSFAKASGYLAKTDKIDAKVISEYMSKVEIKPNKYITTDYDKISSLVIRKLQLKKN